MLAIRFKKLYSLDQTLLLYTYYSTLDNNTSLVYFACPKNYIFVAKAVAHLAVMFSLSLIKTYDMKY